jgi:ABC-type lipoprotein release transport system permease subunit
MNTTPVAVRQYRQLIGLLPAGAGFLQSLLFEVRPLNGGTYLGTALVLVTPAVVASYFPAPTATAINPVDAIRADQ